MLADFHLLRPWWLLALLPLAATLFWLARSRSRRSNWEQCVDPELFALLAIDAEPRSQRGPLALIALGWLIAVLALAGPSFSQREMPVWRSDVARVLVLDLSRSMDASDLLPSRLVRARHKLHDALQRSADGQTALIVFAAAPYVLSPLTDDADTIGAMLGALSTSLPPMQGGRLDRAVESARELLQRSAVSEGDVLLLTDSEADDSALNAALRLRQAGYRLQVMGVGTPSGAPVPLPGGGLLEDAAGNIVLPKLVEEGLVTLARAGGGSYARLGADDSDLDQLLAERDAGQSRRDDAQQADFWIDSGHWLLWPLMALALLAIRRGLS